MRIGHGFDIHRFKYGDHVTLGGVKIPCSVGIVAHSDGDVMLHALCDALLGAAALGDIGQHFPDTDPSYENADSRDLLRHVFALIQTKGYRVSNVDVTIIAEIPKVLPHVKAMRENIAEDLEISIDDVNVKATTNEKLGHLGRKEGIAAHAVALIERVNP
ncbi:MAG TPA: 2-C-methyl-D-erythritol 2,4-cyclodiphosphate synthase [Pseudomonadales bacterium]|nr:2-C-methyl-D-erythritol 2,4-cyclodiphosphate synthase [Pseudomonadales bacterium]